MKSENHYIHRSAWLRAAVLGANDGILSTASLVIGIAAASDTRNPILLAAVAGVVAGSLSMAAGEYVSVSSQADVEGADLKREREELRTMPGAELQELAAIYRKRGLDENLAQQVALQLTAQCAGNPCAGRTGHQRHYTGEAHAGRVGFCSVIHSRGRTAFAGVPGCALGNNGLFPVWLCPSFPCLLWRDSS